MDLFDLYQHERIRDVSARTAAVGAEVEHQRRGTRDALEEVQARVDRLALVCEALWELARDATGLTDAQLEERVRLLDGSDGEVDGRVRRAATPCTSCGAMVNARARVCVFCSEPAPARAPFSGV